MIHGKARLLQASYNERGDLGIIFDDQHAQGL
jgi:hypothetical protein